jgi:hypothetical protein
LKVDRGYSEVPKFIRAQKEFKPQSVVRQARLFTKVNCAQPFLRRRPDSLIPPSWVFNVNPAANAIAKANQD